eukprot:GHVN01042699.1.p1 GENE.GHVN01042699.1~~GHVN01042699.1.p1  ORF type:complete len:608 (+),score=60.79 GHVN01042699.1:27-1850(+)
MNRSRQITRTRASHERNYSSQSHRSGSVSSFQLRDPQVIHNGSGADVVFYPPQFHQAYADSSGLQFEYYRSQKSAFAPAGTGTRGDSVYSVPSEDASGSNNAEAQSNESIGDSVGSTGVASRLIGRFHPPPWVSNQNTKRDRMDVSSGEGTKRSTQSQAQGVTWPKSGEGSSSGSDLQDSPDNDCCDSRDCCPQNEVCLRLPIECQLKDCSMNDWKECLRACWLLISIALLFICTICIALLVYNEWRQVSHRIVIQPLVDQCTPVSCAPSPKFNDQFVHIDCPLIDLYTFHPPSAFSYNAHTFKGVFYEMRVEMYQWQVKSGLFGVILGGDWSQSLVDSGKYPFLFSQSHVNPDFIPHIEGSGRRFAPSINAGGYSLSGSHAIRFTKKHPLSLTDDSYYSPSTERPPISVDYKNTRVFNNMLYTGDPNDPKIGDLRISFWGSSATHVSLMAEQRQDYYGSYYLSTPSSIQARNASMEVFAEGDYTPQELVSHVLSEKDGHPLLVWGFRLMALLVLACYLVHLFKQCDRHTSCLSTWLGGFFFGFCILSLMCTPLWFFYSAAIGSALLTSSALTLVMGLVAWCYPSSVLKDETSTRGATPRYTQLSER